MKRFYLTLATLACFQISVNAQYSTALVDGNNIEAKVNNGGVFFNDPIANSPGYEYPKGSGKNLIYANAFWFKAEDPSGNPKLSAQLYDLGQDIFPGALTANGAATIGPSHNHTKEVYQVTKNEIDNHIANYSIPGYTVPSSIADWPAHGDASISHDYYLAPFVDVNNDGDYIPSDGDYPKIRGDYATYMILNDKLDVHASGGDPMGIECHFMFYQYNSTDYRDNTTFLNLKVINRSTQDYPEFKVGCFLDSDIGNSQDDLVGCDTNQHVMYAYNGSNSDIIYGDNPPSVGVVNLNQTMDLFGCFKYDHTYMFDPNGLGDYYNYLEGRWKNAVPFTVGGNGYGGTVNTKYLFSGNPNNSGEWSEIEAGLVPGERKMLMATEKGPLLAGEELCLDYAFIIGDGGNHLENVNNLIANAADARNFFNTQADFICANYEETLKNSTHEISEPAIYPIPSNGQMTIDFKGEYSLEIHALDGRKVFEQTNMYEKQKISTNLESGSYIISILQGGNRITKPIIIR